MFPAKKFISSLVLLLMVVLSFLGSANANQKVAFIKEDAIILKFEGSISPPETFGLIMQLGLLQGQDVALFITSPGGMIDLAYDIATLIKLHGKVDCYVMKEVDSAAFQILLPACRTRHALKTSKFGFHQAHAGFDSRAMLNSTTLRQIAVSLDVSTDMMVQHVSTVLATPEEMELFIMHLAVQDQPNAVQLQEEFPSFLTSVVDKYECEGIRKAECGKELN